MATVMNLVLPYGVSPATWYGLETYNPGHTFSILFSRNNEGSKQIDYLIQKGFLWAPLGNQIVMDWTCQAFGFDLHIE